MQPHTNGSIHIDSAISDVARIYRSITGRDLPRINQPIAPIPPERDPRKAAEAALEQLAALLERQAGPGNMLPPMIPPVDCWESADEVVIVVDLPGIDASTLDVKLVDGELRLSGQRERYIPRERGPPPSSGSWAASSGGSFSPAGPPRSRSTRSSAAVCSACGSRESPVRRLPARSPSGRQRSSNMDFSERARLQALVDAVHLTAAALRALDRAPRVDQVDTFRASGISLAPGWWSTPVPRGWPPPHLLGAEREMFVPYVSPYMSHMMPFYPSHQTGLIHSGVGGIPMSGIGYSPMIHPSLYGYRPSPMFSYGYGLMHSGMESPIPMINPLIGGSHMGHMMSPMMGSPMMGMGMSPMMPMPYSGMPMQPAWSMGPMVQSPVSPPHA
ncbi:hypothetical protein AKJ08_3664 [Vulgatibacter incomptus]|uniref:SHSP domain-containing protein n=1 Tax=Vulgatibacter incomptus TaxID=1391653 RepID=A0A0K1PIE6_9BACT|nr:Hsp20/alpha crystallin family protein [Vulgatibacter incomptus]AKU93277.1 hypothetical protein AKJ08_3664 [Vulgatibacter incomptus]